MSGGQRRLLGQLKDARLLQAVRADTGSAAGNGAHELRDTGQPEFARFSALHDQARSNTISCAPFHSVILPSGARFSSPDVIVMKWLPASWPILLAKRTPP
jgi:hypothetical protein